MTNNFGGEQEYLMSEYATLVFLSEIKHVPAPKVHGFSFRCNNSVRTPYFFMDKVPGISFYRALRNGLSRAQIYTTLRDLAQIKKRLMEHPFYEIGSLTIMDNNTCEYEVDRHLTLSDYNDYIQNKHRRTGPYESGLQYYANLLHVGWLYWHDNSLFNQEPDVIREQWKIHAYLCSVLDSYVGDRINQFFLAHTDLNSSNIFVDENGSITGIIDWEFAGTLPLQSADHYPLLLADKQKFTEITEDIYSDPLAELQDWRDFYAKQFVGDSAMVEYLENIETIVAFESTLRDHKEATLDSLVDKFKFLNSKSTLDHIGISFPWREPTKSHLESISATVFSTSEEQTRDRLSSESPSLNDFVVQPSRFSKFVDAKKRKVGNVSGRMKG
jgi:serine/threonine protein kinase